MQNKLQELTDRLYNEGLSKGKEEGEAILAAAKKEAEAIVAEAKKAAEAILQDAQKQADDLKSKVNSDVKMAASQALQSTKKDVENLIVANVSDKAVASKLSSADFVKELIKTVAEKFSTDESADLSLVLPEALKADLEPYVQGELAKTLKNGISASFSKKIAGGFTIGPKDEGWFISLTDESFQSLIAEYLRPVTKKILFGE